MRRELSVNVSGTNFDKTTLSCGDLWGHGGDIHGYESRGGVTTDGREVTVVVNAPPAAIISKKSSMEAMTKEAMRKAQVVMDMVDTAICE